jgi:hypothetical protein
VVGVENLALTARKFTAIKAKDCFFTLSRVHGVAATPEKEGRNEVRGGHQSNRSDYALYTRR